MTNARAVGIVVETEAPLDDIAALRARIRELDDEIAALRAQTVRDEELRRLCERVELALLVIDDVPSGRMGWANDAAARLFGFPSGAAMRGETVQQSYRDAKERQEIYQHYMADPRFRADPTLTFDAVRIRRDDGEPVPVRFTLRADLDADGRPRRFYLVAQDRREAHASRRFEDSEARFRFVFEDSPVGIALAIGNQTLTRVNRAFAAIVGVPEGELPGRALLDFVHPADRAAVVPGTPAEVRIVHRDGREVPCSLVVSGERDASDYSVVSLLDLTARVDLEEERRRGHRREALARLAAGIAHDFNNVLVGVLGALELATETPTPERWIAHARKAALRARDLTHRLMTFADGGAPVRATLDLDRVLRRLAEAELPRVRLALDPLPPVDADPVQIAEALRCLFSAARDAAPTAVVEVSAEVVAVASGGSLPIAPGPYVRVAVTDTGPTPDARQVGAMFDPFATHPGRGDGLSLATAWSIARRHGGHVAVEPRLGGGATLALWLPARATPPEPELPPQDSPRERPYRVLVMDDEPMLRDTTVALLLRAGYRAEAVPDATSAEEAVRQAVAEGRPYAAALLDLTIPGGRGGIEAVGALAAIDPGLRAIVSSGYSHVPAMADPRAYGFVAALPKPYRLEDLVRVLRETIGSR